MPRVQEAAANLLFQEEILERIARRDELTTILIDLCRLVEAVVPTSVCSILLLDAESSCLRVAAAPGAPAELVAELDGLRPGPLAGSCGTAVYTERPAIVGDTLVDQRWKDMRDLARAFGIRSCWSLPIVSRRGAVLGSYAISRTVPGDPGEPELALLRSASNLAGLAIDCEQGEAELRAQKELLQSILESTEDPIFAKDTQGRYLIVNSAEAKGVRERPEDMLGLTDSDLYPHFAERSRKMEEEIFRTGKGCHYEEVFHNKSEGRRVFLTRKNPIFDDEGRPRGVVGIARDITNLRHAEEALHRAQKLESLGVLAGGIAHDFNNLLTGILGNADLALNEVEEGSLAWTCLREVRRASLRASELTNQMLAYSGKGDFVRRRLSLPETMKEVAQLLASSISRKVTLRYDVEPDVPAVEGDASQLRQVVMNLLTNASEALDDEPGEVRVVVRSATAAETREHVTGAGDRGAAAPHVVLSVTDTGCGMDEETRERMFDPFFTTKFAGRGLGLAAVQGIVRGHRGAIDVRTSQGSGTTFTVYLPACEGAAEREPRASGTAVTAAVGPGTVLVVDDEDAVRELSRRVLTQAGLEVVTARDGQEAVEILEGSERAISAVVLDLTTPRLSGYAAWQKLRELRPGVPVVLASGYGETDATRGFAEADLAGFLQKPYRPAELLVSVQRALAGCARE